MDFSPVIRNFSTLLFDAREAQTAAEPMSSITLLLISSFRATELLCQNRRTHLVSIREKARSRKVEDYEMGI